MPILNFDNFVKLPEGAIFSYFEPVMATGFYVKGETLYHEGQPIDYFESNLIAHESWTRNRSEFALRVDDTPGRWCTYIYDQLYYVYDKADMQLIQSYIQKALEKI